MTESWKEWEGQVVDGEFQLRQYLGGSQNSAVFLIDHGERELQRAAIKLIPEPSDYAELQLSRWSVAAKLSHPHLIRIFQTGRCQLGGMGLLYVVMEYGDENLSQILAQRPLTAAEAREMLEPVLDTLAYVHSQGFVHGHIKPANVMAVADQLKISSDGLCRMDESSGGLGMSDGPYDAPEMAAGKMSPAADVWSLGMALVEALTRRLPVWQRPGQGEPALPETLSAPFVELARHCLTWDPQRRWTIADIAAHMRQAPAGVQSRTSASSLSTAFAKWRYATLALGVAIAAVLVGPRLFNRQRTPSPVAQQPVVQREPERAPVTPEASKPTQTGDQAAAAPPSPAAGRVPGKVVHQVLPDVPRSARGTIQGRVRVGVRVHVDPSGSVAGAKLYSPGPSKYFAGLALKAARRWKFDPAQVDGSNVASDWILRFEFGKAGTKAFSVRAAP